MKFLFPLALLAVGAVAQTTTADAPAASATGCDADYIVTNCLESETDKVSACDATDYDCLCAAYEAVATCYNNCPNDTRAAPAQQQVKVFCQNASLYGTHKDKVTKTAGGSTMVTAAATTTAADEEGTSTATEVSAPSSTNAAGEKVRNAGSVLAAIGAVLAAVM
ncbi:Fc.00g100760.m01.CDS01 [Cosmosporella sp. VM-42]